MWVKLLTLAGAAVTIASIVFGIWLQFAYSFPHQTIDGGLRLSFAIEALQPLAIGILILAAARILAAFQTAESN